MVRGAAKAEVVNSKRSAETPVSILIMRRIVSEAVADSQQSIQGKDKKTRKTSIDMARSATRFDICMLYWVALFSPATAA